MIDTPGVNVDLVYKRDLSIGGRDVTLGLSGRNLLGTEHSETMTVDGRELDFNSYERGRSFSVSLSAKF